MLFQVRFFQVHSGQALLFVFQLGVQVHHSISKRDGVPSEVLCECQGVRTEVASSSQKPFNGTRVGL